MQYYCRSPEVNVILVKKKNMIRISLKELIVPLTNKKRPKCKLKLHCLLKNIVYFLSQPFHHTHKKNAINKNNGILRRIFPSLFALPLTIVFENFCRIREHVINNTCGYFAGFF